MAEEIIKDIDVLKNISLIEDCDSIEEGKIIAQEMFKSLASQKTAPGIAANQIGIHKKVIALSVREPLYFVNPKITSAELPFPQIESHSSFPQKLFTTIRFASITLTADNIDGEIVLGLKPNQRDLLYTKNKLNVAVTTHPVIMEAVYVQQTIDTLTGVMPTERVAKITEPIRKDNTPGRNEIVVLQREDQFLKIKYKNVSKYLNDGWVVTTNRPTEFIIGG